MEPDVYEIRSPPARLFRPGMTYRETETATFGCFAYRSQIGLSVLGFSWKCSKPVANDMHQSQSASLENRTLIRVLIIGDC